MKLQLPKILRLDSRFSPHVQQRIKEKYKASFDKSKSSRPERTVFYLGEHSWKERYQHYDRFAEAYPLFGKACLALAGICTAQGVFFKPAEKKQQTKTKNRFKLDVQEQDETNYALAEEAVYRSEQFRDQQYIISKFYDTINCLAKQGSCFWEITDAPVFTFRIPPLQECIEPAEADAQGTIIKWRQVVNGVETASWGKDELILLSWNPTTATWPYGNGLGVGLDTEMEALIEMETSAKDYMIKQAWPYEALALGDGSAGSAIVTDEDYSGARSEWMGRKAGDGFVTRNMPIQIIPGGTGSAPIRELSVLCTLMKDNVHDGMMVAPISKLYNSTEASAKVLTQQIMTAIGQPLQWLVKEKFESAILKAMLEASGFSRKSCPATLFESPDVHKKEEGEYWIGLVNAKIQSPKQACDHMDLEYDEAYFAEELKREQEQFNKQLEAKKQAEPAKDEAPQKFGESYLVTKVHKHD